MPKILVIDDNADICFLLSRYLSKNGFETEVANTGKEAIKRFNKSTFDLVLCDFRLPDADGLEMIQALKKIDPSIPIIIITGYSDVKLAVEVMKKGAFEYVTKPINQEEILHTIQTALAEKSTSELQENKLSKTSNNTALKTDKKINFVKGVGVRALQLQKMIGLVAPTNMSVVISGESGTGKEVTAQAIHYASKRKNQNIIAVDCGAIPKELAGSMLFGHVKGSFTGAQTDKVGYFQAAHKGTLFLDEIGKPVL